MADKKITELPILTNATAHDSDVVPIVDVSVGKTHKMTLAEMLLRFQGNPGPKGDTGDPGDPGPQGVPGAGVPNGGTTSQVLAKKSNTDLDTEWKSLTKTDVGLSNVDNTSDADKPVSTATATALSNKQDKFTGGTDGQVLTKVSGSPAWANAPTGIPSGGTTGQALVKASNSNGDVTWATIESGLNVSTTQSLAAAGTISLLSVRRQRVKIKASAPGNVTVSLPDGTIDGQEVYVLGMSDIETCTIENSTNVASNGDITFTLGTFKLYIWEASLSVWNLM